MLLRKYVQRCIRAVSKQAFISYIYLYAISYQYVPPPVTIPCKTYYIVNYKVKVLEFLFLQHVGFMQILSPSSYLTFLLPLLEIQIHRPQITFSEIRFAANFSYLRNRGRKSNVVEKETKTCWNFLCVLKEQKSIKSCQQLFSRKQQYCLVFICYFLRSSREEVWRKKSSHSRFGIVMLLRYTEKGGTVVYAHFAKASTIAVLAIA